MDSCESSLKAEHLTYQSEGDGSIPILSLHFRVLPITALQALEGYKKWHYLGKTRFISTVNYAACFGNKIYGCISLGAPNATEMRGLFTRHTQQGWWEIKRLAMHPSCPKNSESKFIGIALRLLQKDHLVIGIITLADSSVGHCGTIYKASGFTYIGLSSPKKDFYVDGKIQQRGKTKGINGEWKPRSQKHVFFKKLVGDNADLQADGCPKEKK